MAIPFKSSITLGQIFAQNDDFRILADGDVVLQVNSNSSLLSSKGTATLSHDTGSSGLNTNSLIQATSGKISFIIGTQTRAYLQSGHVQLGYSGDNAYLTLDNSNGVKLYSGPDQKIQVYHGPNIPIEIDQREVKLGSGTQSLDLRHTMLYLNGVLGSVGQVISSSGTAAVCEWKNIVLYEHNVRTSNDRQETRHQYFRILNNDPDEYNTGSSLSRALYNLGYRTTTIALEASGKLAEGWVCAVFSGSPSDYPAFVYYSDSGSEGTITTSSNTFTIDDTVRRIYL